MSIENAKVEERSTEESSPKEKNDSSGKSSLTKKVGRTVLPLALALGMVGCSGDKESESKSKQASDPVESDLEDILEGEESLHEEIKGFNVSEEGKLEINNDQEDEIKEIQTNYGNYEIKISSEVVEKLLEYEGEHDIYEVKDINHVQWVEEFINALGRNDLEYMVKPHPEIEGDTLHTKDQSNHIWERGQEFAHYRVSSDLLTFVFDQGVKIPGVDIDPNDKESVEKGLKYISNQFFSPDFNYQVNSISKEGENYKVDYSRVLGDTPISMNIGNPYILLTPEGYLKEGWFSLAEFEKSKKTSLTSLKSVVKDFDNLEYPKDLRFTFAQPNLEYELFPPDTGYRRTGEEFGSVNLDKVEFSYRYDSKFQDFVSPHLTLTGSGFVKIEDEKAQVNDDFNANFEISVRLQK